MPKKRRRRGRSKGIGKGKVSRIQCSACGALVPRDKVKKVTRYRSIIDPSLAKELEAQGAFIPRQKMVEYYCVSCAIFRGIIKVRAKEERRMAERLL